MLTWTSARLPDGEQSCGEHFSQGLVQNRHPAWTRHVVDLIWVASTSNDVAGYKAYRLTAQGGRKSMTALVAATYYNDSTISNGSSYF